MKRLVLLSLLSLSSPVAAQVFPWGGVSGGGGGGPPDPSRDDVAASYTATGANGVRTVPQVDVAALGTCSALAGAWAATTPEWETQVTGYFCNGTRWARVWTDEDGVTVSPDRTVAGRTFVSQAASGDYAFKANNRPVWDLGDGINDELVSLGSRIRSYSWEVASGGSLTTDILGPTTANADLIVSLQARWLRLSPGGAPACDSTRAGGLQSRSTDGNRPWHCDGTNAYRIARIIPISATITIPTMAGGDETALSTTVTGAQVGDHVTVNMGCDLAQISVRRFRVSAANTVSIIVANEDPATPLPVPTDCLFAGAVYK